MRMNRCIQCDGFPCPKVNHAGYAVSPLDLKPEAISIVLISETAPGDPKDYYYARGNPLFEQTTVQAFRDAGAEVSTVHDILRLGVYLTTAVKCAKTDYTVDLAAIRECSALLQKELALFPNVKAILLMGDVAIRAMNFPVFHVGFHPAG